MPTKNDDMDKSAPDTCETALIIIDMINDLEFPGGECISEPALAAAEKIATLKKKAKESGIAVIFANDNFGRWRSNFREAITHCLEEDVRGSKLAELLRPDPKDYFILKPKHSAFYATPLELLLKHLGSRRLILCGISGSMCVQFTACDAYMRDFELFVPEDCMASNSEEENQQALHYMQKFLKAQTTCSDRLDLTKLHAEARG